MRIEINTDEWYPVYTARIVEKDGCIYGGTVIDIDDAEGFKLTLAYEKACAELTRVGRKLKALADAANKAADESKQ